MGPIGPDVLQLPSRKLRCRGGVDAPDLQQPDRGIVKAGKLGPGLIQVAQSRGGGIHRAGAGQGVGVADPRGQIGECVRAGGEEDGVGLRVRRLASRR